VGKSRFVYEITRPEHLDGARVIQAHCVSWGIGASYLPILNLLRSYFRIQEGDPQEIVRDKVAGALARLDALVSRDLTALPSIWALLTLLDVRVEEPEWQTLDRPQRRGHMHGAIKRLLLRESQVQPLCLVFEDLHWLDTETRAVLDDLVESLQGARILLLINYRPEYRHGWGGKTHYSQVRIDPLREETAIEFLGSSLGADASLNSLKLLLTTRAEGNPFFLEESVRMLAETGVLAGEPGRYRLARPASSIQIPTTVQAVLSARIDRLAPEDKHLLQIAAVLGKDVQPMLLQAIAEESTTAVEARLARLRAGEFLYETGLLPHAEYSFKHTLTQEVAYSGLPEERRRELHARLVGTIETFHADCLGEQAERLAHHAFRAEMWPLAVRYLRQAGAKALARSATREAAAALEQGLVALSHLPESGEWLKQGIDIRLDLRDALFPLGDSLDMIGQYLTEAEPLAQTLGDPRRLGWVMALRGNYLHHIGRSAEAQILTERACAIAEATDDFQLRVVATQYFGMALFHAGNYPRAAAIGRTMIETVDSESGRDAPAVAEARMALRSVVVRALAELGEFEDGIACGQEAIRIGDSIGPPFRLTIACADLGSLLRVKGDFDAAMSMLQRARAVVGGADLGAAAQYVIRALGYVNALAGRADEGLSLLKAGLAMLDRQGLNAYRPNVLAQIGEAYLCSGRFDDAVAAAETALMLARQRGLRGWQAWVLRLFGEIGSHRDPPDTETAEDYYRQSVALATELGMRPLVAHCHLGLGKLYRRTDNPGLAHEHLGTATTMYREMGMTFWLEKTEAEIRGLT
jgi:tetratricopeptide (TPR) repeat protein